MKKMEKAWEGALITLSMGQVNIYPYKVDTNHNVIITLTDV